VPRLDGVEEGLMVVVDPGEEEPRLGRRPAERLGAGVERLGDGVGGVGIVAVSGGGDYGSAVLVRGDSILRSPVGPDE
jgi:hypothetical protein